MHELAEESGEREGKTRDLGFVVEQRREGEKEQAPLAKHSSSPSIEQKKLTFFSRSLNDHSVSPSILSADFSRLGQQVRKKKIIKRVGHRKNV